MDAVVDSSEIFDNLTSDIGKLHFGRTEAERTVLSKTLDQLNAINYRYIVVRNPTKAVLLVNQCCSFIPTDDEILVKKCSKLLRTLINQQSVSIEGKTLTISIQWCLNSLTTKNELVIIEVLNALNALLRSSDNRTLLVDGVTKEIQHFLTERKQESTKETILVALQCLEACTMISNSYKSENLKELYPKFELCAEIFIAQLKETKHNFDKLTAAKVLQVCLAGLKNIIIQYTEYLSREIGVILGLVKSFMLYGVDGFEDITPQKLFPATLSIPEISNPVEIKKGGKLKKQRKHRVSGGNKLEKYNANLKFENENAGYIPATVSLEYNSDSGSSIATLDSRLKTSDSDISDGEATTAVKINRAEARVRQVALHLFFNVIRLTEKSTIFSYWTSFIPEGTAFGKHNLLTCILKDPSTRTRMDALNVLLLLLTTSKLYLSQAELTERTTSFTPFSVVMGLTIKELHKGLSLALNEIFVPVLTQVLKCFAALVQATPYHRMPQSLISKVIRNVKPFIFHKDASVQVTALIVLGCVLASEPVIPETKEVLLKMHNLESESSAEEHSEEMAELTNYNLYFDFEEDSPVESVFPIPWFLKKCLTNLGLTFEKLDGVLEKKGQNIVAVAATVKLESLQVLSSMSRNYFDTLMAPHLVYITKALCTSLTDTNIDIKLHAGRAVDFIGQAISKYMVNVDITEISLEHCQYFWKTLLNEPLINLVQCEQQPILRAVGCDCLGSIGPNIFEQLPRDKQLLCMTLLFSCTRDEENSVKGAAVRALAICVRYPSLSEDAGFVVDTAEAVYRTLKDNNLMVRVKASWSLGNLTDALVLNSKSTNDVEDIPESLILKLLEVSVSAAADNDKIRMNAVRAIGNLLQIITNQFLENAAFVQIIEHAFSILVKSCTTGSNMKVRWNSCYALGNAMKNKALYEGFNGWQKSVFNSLTELVVGFRNFKVRINTALALSAPPLREHYGAYYFSVWIALLKALDNSQNIEDLSEYKHRDQLVDQVCLSLGHLTSVLHKDDLLRLQDVAQPYLDTFKMHMHKVLDRIVPEEATALFSVADRLKQFCDRSELNCEEKSVLISLINIFVP